MLEADPSPDLLALDAALTKLNDIQERMGQVVELRYFGGLTLEQVAETLGVSLGTVRADVRFALAWLRSVLEGDPTE